MALWQFTLNLVTASTIRVDGAAAICLSREQLDAIKIDLSSEDMQRLSSWLDDLLPEKESWSKSLRIWGTEETDDARIWLEDERVESVQFRINAGDVSLALVSGICAIARNLRCVLASGDGLVLQPTSEAIIQAVLQSPATRFVRDPQAYLEAIDAESD